MAFQKKKKKDVAPWREGILSHHQSRPTKADRGEFPRSVIKQLMERANGRCEACRQREDTETHHIMPKGRMSTPGRGVFTNGLRLCRICHDEIQTNEEELQHWISVYRDRYGEHFWFDEADKDEFNRKQAAEREIELEKKHREGQLEPIISLLSIAAGRRLNAKEVRLLDTLDERQMSIFAKLMQDVVGEQMTEKGYGHFED